MRAPVAIFGYNRPQHLREVFRHLANGDGLEGRDTTVYMDAPAAPGASAGVDEARAAAHAFAQEHDRVRVVERRENLRFGNITQGISEVCARAGRAIILEDDILVAPDFLAAMDASLDAYAKTESVWSVSGYTPPAGFPSQRPWLFLPYTSSWGWATWDRAWSNYRARPAAEDWRRFEDDAQARRRFQVHPGSRFVPMMRRVMRDPAFTWDIQWNFAMFQAGALSLHAWRSLTWNCGTGQGTHFRHGSAGPELTGTFRSIHGPGSAADYLAPRAPAAPFPTPAVEPRDLQRLRRHFRRLRVEAAWRAGLRVLARAAGR